MSKRVLLVVAIAAIVAGAAAYALKPPTGVPAGAPTLDEMASDVGTDVMRHVVRGHFAGRSGEIMLVPKPNNYLIPGWDLTTLGTDRPTTATAHPNPWDYLARVPIVFYDPGYVEAGREIDASVDIAGVAPTYARVLGMDFEGDADPLPGMEGSPKNPPKVIFTVVIDGGGWNALQEHPDSHPGIDRLRSLGTTYVNATIGSAPSITGALHATFGTGTYPLHHGLPGNQMRGPDGRNTDTWLENADPRYLRTPTVAELWDEQHQNRPVVAAVAYEGWHLGMIGHGAFRPGGDKDIAVLWNARAREEAADSSLLPLPANSWWTNGRYYTLPSYLRHTDLQRLERYEKGLDARDGLNDGRWFGHTLEELQEDMVRPGTPAFVRFTGDAVVDVMRNEGIGDDAVTDFVWVEIKAPDYAGHAWNVTQPEEADVLRETDDQIIRFVSELDRLVGRGNYLFGLSADHGQQPLADLVGGWRINSDELGLDVESRFGNVLEKVTPVDMYLDMARIEKEDIDLADIARYLATYTIGDNIPADVPGIDRVPRARLDENLFAAAFPTGYIASLTDAQLGSLGDGIYEEGDLTSSPGLARSVVP